MPCLGNGKDHCCYIKGEECPFLFRNYVDENAHFRKWACSLRVEHGNWDDVLTDPRWIDVCGNAWAEGLNCRDWPDGEGINNGACKECGVEYT